MVRARCDYLRWIRDSFGVAGFEGGGRGFGAKECRQSIEARKSEEGNEFAPSASRKETSTSKP